MTRHSLRTALLSTLLTGCSAASVALVAAHSLRATSREAVEAPSITTLAIAAVRPVQPAMLKLPRLSATPSLPFAVSSGERATRLLVSQDNASVFAVLYAHDALLTRDDGATFTRRPLPRNFAHHRAAIDGDGALYESTESTLRVLEIDGTLSSRALPMRCGFALLASGHRTLLWICTDRSDPERESSAFASTDRGHTWRALAAPVHATSGDILTIDASGTAQFFYMTDSPCGGGDGGRSIRSLSAPADSAWKPLDLPADHDFALPGAGDWAYETMTDYDSEPNITTLVGRSHGEQVALVRSIESRAEASFNGTSTAFRFAGRFIAVEGAAARVLTDVPEQLRSFVYDARGRIIALSTCGLVRWSAEEGWRPITAASFEQFTLEND